VRCRPSHCPCGAMCASFQAPGGRTLFFFVTGKHATLLYTQGATVRHSNSRPQACGQCTRWQCTLLARCTLSLPCFDTSSSNGTTRVANSVRSNVCNSVSVYCHHVTCQCNLAHPNLCTHSQPPSKSAQRRNTHTRHIHHLLLHNTLACNGVVTHTYRCTRGQRLRIHSRAGTRARIATFQESNRRC
jgi:hypothetical protein